MNPEDKLLEIFRKNAKAKSDRCANSMHCTSAISLIPTNCIFFSMFLIINIYSSNNIVSVIIVIETLPPPKKKFKLFRNSSIETKVETVTNLLRLRLYKDKTN